MEAMAAESLVATAWELDGFLSKLRWPVRVERGYSDIDVVAVNASGVVRLAECKVRDGAQKVYVVRGDFPAWLGQWGSCLENIKRLWSPDARPGWLPAPADARVEMWFCGNIWFECEEDHRAAEASFTQLVRDACPHGLKGTAVGRVVSTRDLLVQVLLGLRAKIVDDRHGKRFGNPVLDTLRELLRYAHPEPQDGGRVAADIAAETQRLLLDALHGRRDASDASVKGG